MTEVVPEVFYGIQRAQDYDGLGDAMNPPLAACVAMLGVSSIDEAHDALVDLGVSTPDGVSDIPSWGVELDFNGTRVTIDAQRTFLRVLDFRYDTRHEFEDEDEAVIVLVERQQAVKDTALYPILLGGQYGGRSTRSRSVLVGDPLLNGVQRYSWEDLVVRLEHTLDQFRVLFSYHVRVE